MDRIMKENEGAGLKEWAGLAVLSLPTFLLGLDVTILYLAFPVLTEDLQPSSTQALWIMDAYGIMIAGFLITMGTLGDIIGRRKLLMIGAAAFGIASIIAAYSSSAEMLVFARAVLGVAGATLMPSTLALISNMFIEPRQRSLAIGIWVIMFSLGMAAGPLIGGILLETFWWGSIFLITLPFVCLILVISPLLLPEFRAPESANLDFLSVVLSLLALLPFIYGIKHMARYGHDFVSVAVLVGGVIFGFVFVRRQLALATPLLDIKLFTNRAFSIALNVLLIGLIGVGGVMFLVTQYLQLVVGLSPLSAGIWMGPPALLMFISAIVSPLMARFVKPGFVMAGALLLSTLGYLLLTQVENSSDLPLVISGFSLVYLGLGSIASLGTDLVVGSAPSSKAGAASAMSETVQELGLAVGVATLGSLATFIYRDQIVQKIPYSLSEDLTIAVEDSLWTAYSVEDRLPVDLIEHARVAFTLGFNTASWVSACFMLILALLSAITLRHIMPIGK